MLVLPGSWRVLDPSFSLCQTVTQASHQEEYWYRIESNTHLRFGVDTQAPNNVRKVRDPSAMPHRAHSVLIKRYMRLIIREI